MNKCIILSIKPEWLKKILNGEKTIEIRKSMPKCDLPIDVYIYCCKGRGSDKSPVLCSMSDFDYDEKTQEFIKKETEYGLNVWKQLVPSFSILDDKIVAKFTLNKIERFDVPYPAWFYEVKEKLQHITDGSCLGLMSLHHYLKNDSGYAWHIDNLEVFDKPIELKEFKVSCKDYHNGWSGCDDYCGYAENHECFGGKHILHQAPQSWCYAYKD